MQPGTSKKLTPEQQAEIDAIAAMPDSEIDTSDAPEIEDWSNAKRGLFYRPMKQQLTLRLDMDVLDYFQRAGKGYQTRINQALREYMVSHPQEK